MPFVTNESWDDSPRQGEDKLSPVSNSPDDGELFSTFRQTLPTMPEENRNAVFLVLATLGACTADGRVCRERLAQLFSDLTGLSPETFQ